MASATFDETTTNAPTDEDDDDDGGGDGDRNGGSIARALIAWSCSSSDGRPACYLSGGGVDSKPRGLRAAETLGTGDVLLLPWRRVLGVRAACNLLKSEHDAGRGVLLPPEQPPPIDDDDDDAYTIATGVRGSGGEAALRWLAGTVIQTAAAGSEGGPGVDEDGDYDHDRRRHGSCVGSSDSDSNSDFDSDCDGDGDTSGGTSSTSSPGHVLWSTVMACALLSTSVDAGGTGGHKFPRSSRSHPWGPYVASLPLLSPAEKVNGDNDAHPRDKHEREPLCHVLLWSDAELEAAGDGELVRTVKTDRIRLRRVWRALFANTGGRSDSGVDPMSDGKEVPPPAVSWEDWLWAHAVLRSRAVAMSGAPLGVTSYLLKAPTDDGASPGAASDGERSRGLGGGPFLLRGEGVLLPLIDMVNHRPAGDGDARDAASANAHLALRPEGVAVVVTDRPVPANAEIFFDYHPAATLRNMFRGYGFVAAPPSGRVRQTYRPRGCKVGLDVVCSRGAVFEERSVSRPMMRAVGVRPNAKAEGGRVMIAVWDGEAAWGLSGASASNDDGDDSGEEEGEELERLPNDSGGTRTSCRPLPWPEPLSFLGGGDAGAPDEGRLCALAAACARFALEEIERIDHDKDDEVVEVGLAVTTAAADDEQRSENSRLAGEYRAANAAIARRCLADLESLAALLGE